MQNKFRILILCTLLALMIIFTIWTFLPYGDLPLPPGSYDIQSTQRSYDAEQREDVKFRVALTPEEVTDFYKERSDEQGWDICLLDTGEGCGKFNSMTVTCYRIGSTRALIRYTKDGIMQLLFCKNRSVLLGAA